jgi:hypothetical protein
MDVVLDKEACSDEEEEEEEEDMEEEEHICLPATPVPTKSDCLKNGSACRADVDLWKNSRSSLFVGRTDLEP